jgi:hypothetical protein
MSKSRPLTEEQWLNASTSYVLLRYLQQHRRITKVPGGRRRLWLFKVACCRLVWDQITDERSRHAVEVCERHIEGKARRAELAAALSAATQADDETREDRRTDRQAGGRSDVTLYLRSLATGAARWACESRMSHHMLHIVTLTTVQLLASLDPEWKWDPRDMMALDKVEPIVADLIRCIFGNPFRPVAIDEDWLTTRGGAVTGMARAIYEDRAFGRLPVLSDALEEAGCPERAILDHCRDGKAHTRGCWAVDALLRKK